MVSFIYFLLQLKKWGQRYKRQGAQNIGKRIVEIMGHGFQDGYEGSCKRLGESGEVSGPKVQLRLQKGSGSGVI